MSNIFFQLLISKDCPELCCNKCSELIIQTVDALDMFKKSDELWRKMFADPNSMMESKTEYLAEDDQASEYLNDDVEKADSEQRYTLDCIKIETLDDTPCDNHTELDDDIAIQSDIVHDKLDISPEVTSVCELIIADKENADKKRVTNIMPYLCSLCDELCRTRVILTRHVMKTHNLKLCLRCDFTAPDSLTLKIHDRFEHLRTIDTISVCQKCKKVFTHPSALTKHMKGVHDPVEPSQCHFCSKICRNQKRLELHLRIHAEPSLKCDICSKMFRIKKHLIAHIKGAHIKNINYICSKCGKQYVEFAAWKIHERKDHSKVIKERPHHRPHLPGKISCSLCNFKLSSLYFGRKHYREKHQIADMSTVCFVCNHLSSSPNELNNHQDDMHSKLRCMICKRFSLTEFRLRLHIEKHSKKERSFLCSVRAFMVHLILITILVLYFRYAMRHL